MHSRGRAGTIALLALGFALVAAIEILFLHSLRPLGNRLDDAFLRARAAKLVPDPEVVIVDVDEASLARMQEEAGSWPWPRAVHAELLNGLLPQKPRAVVFDILFAEADTFRPESDAAFIEALRAAENIYLPMARMLPQDDAGGVPLAEVAEVLNLEQTHAADPDATAALLPPLAVPPELWRTGVINFLEDPDGVGRRYYLYVDVHGWRLDSLPVRVGRDLDWIAPRGESLRLQFRSAAPGFRHVSYADLYEDFQRGQRRRAANEFRDAVVIVGTSASALHDQRVTPLSSRYSGVEILATAIDNLKNGRWLHELPSFIPAIFSVLLIALVAGLLMGRVNLLLVGASLAVAMLGLLAASWFALQRSVVLPVFEPLLFASAFFFTAALLEYVRERAARRETVRLFGRFLDPEVVRRLVERGETVESLSGRSLQLSILFSDIRGFTALSETRPPQEVVDLLNRYFQRQVAVVFRHGGTLDKFIGDCIMAFWGAPIEDPRHARRAVECALDMERELFAFRKELGEAGRNFDVGIGIHSGSAVVGFVGAEQKLDYTAIGDAVNLASRIEGLTRGLARILVSRETAEACGGVDFIARGSYAVKGRAQAVELFEPRTVT